MTRRELLAMLPAATVKTSRAAEVVFERIDTDSHIHRRAPALVAAMEKTGWRGLSICDSREVGDQVSVLPEMIPGTARFHRESQGRSAWATTFDVRGFEKPVFAEQAIGGLQQGFAQEAIAVKIWKNIGMGSRSAAGTSLRKPEIKNYEAERLGKHLLLAHGFSEHLNAAERCRRHRYTCR